MSQTVALSVYRMKTNGCYAISISLDASCGDPEMNLVSIGNSLRRMTSCDQIQQRIIESEIDESNLTSDKPSNANDTSSWPGYSFNRERRNI